VVEYTEAFENFIKEKANKAQTIASTHSQKVKDTAYTAYRKPLDMYGARPTYHRGLF
jgi:hypothetical protein